MPSRDRRDAVKAMTSAGQRELVAELERLDDGARSAAPATPGCGFPEDAAHFHQVLKNHCDTYAPAFHAQAKRRATTTSGSRTATSPAGIGGIAFDHLHPPGPHGRRRAAAFTVAGIAALAPAYLPIVRRRMRLPRGERQRQLPARGRYVEFALAQDAAMAGEADVVLMGLPPMARWDVESAPEPGSAEAEPASSRSRAAGRRKPRRRRAEPQAPQCGLRCV